MTRHARLDADIPSVVPFATDPSGEARTDVRVTIDGDSLVSRIDGRALRIDPGMHEFVFHSSDGVAVTEKVMILQGDRNRRIAVSLSAAHRERPAAAVARVTPVAAHPVATAPVSPATVAETEPPREPMRRDATESAPAPPATESSKRIPVASWVLGGVAVVGVGGFVLLSARGKSDNDQLAQTCGKTGSCHLFRHAMGSLYLKHRPGDFETVRLVLGHKSLETTAKSYAFTDRDAAVRRFWTVIEGLSGGGAAR